MIDALVDLARRLVACDTTSAKSNLPAIELLADRLHALGFRTRVQSWQADGVAKANLVATAGPAEPGGLIVSGHTDTVPWEEQPGWTRDALALEIGDDRVYGRGSSHAVRGALLGADGCRFQSVGVRSLICGPGDFAEAHQPNESISRRAFEEGTGIIRSVVERLCLA
jgi:acetylornithine deacetylase/succinyl-diaminopimelate desuccinylase-like protein